MAKEKLIDIEKLRIRPDGNFLLKDHDTHYSGNDVDKLEAEALLAATIKSLAEKQDKLYADSTYGFLIVLQAMDGGGKDSIIRHVMSGLNPQGVRVTSFKVPTTTELRHDYLWRHYKELPARGEIAIFNRSHYENVVITKVHPELVLLENLPTARTLADIDDKFWKARYKQINRFEKNIVQNSTIIVKFFLHLSRKEQKKRFLERIENPGKNWKFSVGDLRERARWEDYQDAYEKCINATSTDHAPWFVIPADDKWYTRLAIAAVIHNQLEGLKLEYPQVSAEQKAELEKSKKILLEEPD